MDLRRIRYFVAVAEELHFGHAATRLHISQPPLSQQIQALEKELGVQLFIREHKRVRLTPAGQIFLDEARSLLNQAARAVEVTQRAARGETGLLRIGFTSSLPYARIMPRIIQHFRSRYPHIQLQLEELSSRRQIPALAQDKLDIGFLRPSSLLQDTGLEHLVLLEEPLVAVMPASHPLASRRSVQMPMLRDEPFIFYATRLGSELTAQIVNMCHQAGFSPNVVQEVYEMHTILGLVATGLGISIVADSLRQVQLDNIVYVPLEAPAAVTQVLLAWRRHPASPVLDNFLATARQLATPVT
jgi:DNA-binding transcriptional LysR family regulator